MWSEREVEQLESDNKKLGNVVRKENLAFYQDYSKILSIIAPKLGLRLLKLRRIQK